MNPRLNQYSLLRMARRQARSILSSSFKGSLLSAILAYLDGLVLELEQPQLAAANLFKIEQNLETLDAALKHLSISFPYNETLFIPKKLPQEQIARLNRMLSSLKENQRHLKIASEQAA